VAAKGRPAVSRSTRSDQRNGTSSRSRIASFWSGWSWAEREKQQLLAQGFDAQAGHGGAEVGFNLRGHWPFRISAKRRSERRVMQQHKWPEAVTTGRYRDRHRPEDPEMSLVVDARIAGSECPCTLSQDPLSHHIARYQHGCAKADPWLRAPGNLVSDGGSWSYGDSSYHPPRRTNTEADHQGQRQARVATGRRVDGNHRPARDHEANRPGNEAAIRRAEGGE
jgi:hypothetical protein